MYTTHVCMFMLGKLVSGSFLLLPMCMKSVPDGRACNEYLQVQEDKKLYLFLFYIGLFFPVRCSVSLHC